MGKVLTLKEAAIEYKVNPKTLERLCREGKVAGAFRIGNLWRIDTTAIDESKAA